MKKALLVALCFMLVGFLAVNGTFAGDFGKRIEDVFKNLTDLLVNLGQPQDGGDQVKVALVSGKPGLLYPGASVTYTTAVRNEGTQPVYFRLVIAAQYEESSWDALKFEFKTEGADFLSTEDWMPIDVDGTPYRMMVFTYSKALEAEEKSPEVSVTLTMDISVTNEQIARYRSDFLQAQVLAIETEAFAEIAPTAQTALDMALPIDEEFNPF